MKAFIRFFLRLICKWKKHVPVKAVISTDRYIYAFGCKLCGKPMGQPIVRGDRNPGTSPGVQLRYENILYSDRIRHIHKWFDHAKALG